MDASRSAGSAHGPPLRPGVFRMTDPSTVPAAFIAVLAAVQPGPEKSVNAAEPRSCKPRSFPSGAVQALPGAPNVTSVSSVMRTVRPSNVSSLRSRIPVSASAITSIRSGRVTWPARAPATGVATTASARLPGAPAAAASAISARSSSVKPLSSRAGRSRSGYGGDVGAFPALLLNPFRERNIV